MTETKAKRGRPRGNGRFLQAESERDMLVTVLADIASGDGLREALKILNLNEADYALDAPSFLWAKARASGALTQIGRKP